MTRTTRPASLLASLALLGTAHCGTASDSPGADDAGPVLAGGDAGDAASNADAASADAAASDGGSAGIDSGRARRDSGAPAGDAAAGADAASATDGGPDDGAPPDAGSDTSTVSGAKIVGGYYPNWTPSPVRIKDVDPHYNLIYLFAATPVGGSPGHGDIEWTPPGDGQGAATNLNADIAYARQTQGRKIILSIGGANESMAFPDRATSQAFVSSVAAVNNQLGGVDGIDWDTYEGSDSPDTSEMIWIGQQLKVMYPGFLITTPPAPWSTVDQAFCKAMAAAGALDYAAPQYYDGPGLATQSYIVPSADTWSSLVGEDRLVIGFGISTAANYMTVGQVISTWNAAVANHPGLRGAFDWEIDVDQSTGWPFATQVGPLIDP